MTTVEETQVKVEALVTQLGEANMVLDQVDAKLDEIRAFIQSLQDGSVMTQEQLDALNIQLDAATSLVGAGKAKAAANLAETDALDDEAPQA